MDSFFLSAIGFWLFMGVISFHGMKIHLTRYKENENLSLDYLKTFDRSADTDPELKNFLTYKVITSPIVVLIISLLLWPLFYHIVVNNK